MDNSTAKLNVVRTDVEPCHVRLDIEVPVDRAVETYNAIVNEFNRAAKVPGFRPGRVPRKLLLTRYSEEIANESRNRLMQEAVEAALEQEGIDPVTAPRPENEEAIRFTPEQPFVFAVTFDVAPSFKLPEYKGISLSRDATDVDDSSVQEVIDGWLKQRTSFEKVDRAAAAGDLLKVSYSGTAPEDSEEPAETRRFLLEAENTWMALREPSLIPGVTESLVGLEAGDEKDITITFPDEFAEESLAGKSVPYHFKVHEVHEAQVPELTDDLAKEVGAESADDVRERIRENLAAEKEREQSHAVRDQLVQALLEGLDFPLPPNVLGRSTYDTLSRMYEQEIRRGANEDDLRGRQKELLDRATEVARQQLRRYYVLDRIADAEKIDVTAEEVYSAIDSLSRAQQVTPKVMARRLRESGRLSEMIVALREAKTLERLLALADVSEAAGDDKE